MKKKAPVEEIFSGNIQKANVFYIAFKIIT